LDRDSINILTGEILDASICVHKEMGPGLMESIYQQCLVRELRMRGYSVGSLVPVALTYKGYALDKNYIIDLIVEDEIIVELKAVESILPVHEAQLISYLKLANKTVGLLINFNVPKLIDGYRRFVNQF